MLAIAFRSYALYTLAGLAVLGFGWSGHGYWHVPEFATWREPSLLGLAVYLLAVCAFVLRRAHVARLYVPDFSPWTIALFVLLVCWTGERLLFQGFQPSADEQMAVFDAAIFQSGRLYAPLAPGWIPDSAALNRDLILPLTAPIAWVSSYLPFNAAIRAGFGALGAADLASPAMAAGSVGLLWSIARRLWPEDRGAATVALVILAGSGQFILTGMTAYAMTAHLLCNLAWLRLYLQRCWWADGLAMIVGFVATGLHQAIFHPLFAGPLIGLLICQREWKRAAAFTFGYALIAIFWNAWPGWMVAQITGSQTQNAATAPALSFAARLKEVLHVDWSNLFLQIYNLLTFVSWQHMLLVPLCFIAFRGMQRDPLMLSLVAGVVATVVAIGVILPFQGFGYGYRYLHGFLGSFALFAGLAWHQLAAERARWNPLLAITTIASIGVLLPFEMWSPYSSFHMTIDANQRVAESGTDLFIVDSSWGARAEILVSNAPDLDRRPVRVILNRIADPEGFARRHCRAGTVAGFGTPQFYRSAIEPFMPKGAGEDAARIIRLRSALIAAGCSLRPVD